MCGTFPPSPAAGCLRVLSILLSVVPVTVIVTCFLLGWGSACPGLPAQGSGLRAGAQGREGHSLGTAVWGQCVFSLLLGKGRGVPWGRAWEPHQACVAFGGSLRGPRTCSPPGQAPGTASAWS